MRIFRSASMLLLVVAGLAMAQDAATSGVDPMAGNGSIQNNLYTNSYFGFTYKFPTTWKVLRGPDTVAQTGGCGSADCRLLVLEAQKGTGRVEIRAVPLPQGTTARAVLEKAAAREEAMGLKPVGAVSESESGGWKFYRVDYKSVVSGRDILESLLVTEAKSNALVITVLTDSRNTLNELASGMTGEGIRAAQQGQASK